MKTSNEKETKPVKRQKELYFQVRENLKYDINIKKIMKKYGNTGIGIYFNINIELFNNQGSYELDWEAFTNKKNEKYKVLDIIRNYGLYEVNEEEETFYSPDIVEQLEERGRKSNTYRKNREKGIKKAEEEKKRYNEYNEYKQNEEEKKKVENKDLIIENIMDVLYETEIEKPIEKDEMGKTFEILTDEELDDCFSDFPTLNEKIIIEK